MVMLKLSRKFRLVDAVSGKGPETSASICICIYMFVTKAILSRMSGESGTIRQMDLDSRWTRRVWDIRG